MNLSSETISSTVGLLSIAAIGLAIYNSLKKPQERSAITDAVYAEKMKTLNEIFELKIRGVEDMVANLRDNHIHTIETTLNKHIDEERVSGRLMASQINTIQVLINERLPRK